MGEFDLESRSACRRGYLSASNLSIKAERTPAQKVSAVVSGQNAKNWVFFKNNNSNDFSNYSWKEAEESYIRLPSHSLLVVVKLCLVFAAHPVVLLSAVWNNTGLYASFLSDSSKVTTSK